MRAKEFEVPFVLLIPDIRQWQIEECRKELRKSARLFESTTEFLQVKDFVAKFKTVPSVGQKYSLASLLFLPPAKIISVAKFPEGQLLQIQNGVMFFDFNGVKRTFPEDQEGGDLLQATVLFATIKEQHEFITWLHLTFSEWAISIK